MNTIDKDLEELLDKLLYDLTTKKPDVVTEATQSLKALLQQARIDELEWVVEHLQDRTYDNDTIDHDLITDRINHLETTNNITKGE